MVQNTEAPPEKVRERQREILRAASQVFRRKGLQATGMRDIAAELGMAVGNLYYYFESREALLAFCQQDGLDGLLALATAVRARRELTADARLHLLVAGHVVRLLEETPGSLAHLDVETLPGEPRASVVRRRRAYEHELRELLAEGVAAGVLRDDTDPKLAAMAILGAVNWTARWYRAGGSETARGIGEAFAALLVRSVLAPGRQPATLPADLLDRILAAPAPPNPEIRP